MVKAAQPQVEAASKIASNRGRFVSSYDERAFRLKMNDTSRNTLLYTGDWSKPGYRYETKKMGGCGKNGCMAFLEYTF